MATLSELEKKFRHDSGDKAKPYVFPSLDVREWANEAQREACKRMDLLREADDESMCRIPVGAGDTAMFELDQKWTRITGAWWLPAGSEDDPEPQRKRLEIVVDRQVLDRRSTNWRDRTSDPCVLLIERRKARFDCIPAAAGTLIVEGFRLPLEAMASDGATPEIDNIHHNELVRWMLQLAFTSPDTEMRDTNRAQVEGESFGRYFGQPRDADLWQPGEHAPPFNLAQW